MGLLIGGLVDWWIGGLVEWKLAAWGSEALQVTSSTRDRDGSADYVSWRLWESTCTNCTCPEALGGARFLLALKPGVGLLS